MIGVLPEDFRFLQHDPEVVFPLRLDRATVRLGQFNFQGIARLKPGVTIAGANADLARLIPRLVDMFPMPPGLTKQMFEEVKLGPNVRPLHEDAVGDIGRALWILFGTVGVVLLVACANVANLFLVRAEGRQQELAVRLALGAGIRRIVGELLTESVLLGVIGGVLGLALAYGGIQLLIALQPARLPRLHEITLDPLVVAFTFAISLLAGVLFGIAPILKYARPQLASALKENGRGTERRTGTSPHAQHARRRAGGTRARPGRRVGPDDPDVCGHANVPPGFTHPENVLTLRITIPTALVSDPVQVAQAYDQIQQRIAAVPGVGSVGASSSVTMDGNDSNDPIFAEGVPMPEGKIPPLRRHKWIGENYFKTMGNPIIAGRDMTWSDVHNRRGVAVVSENMAREFFGSPQAAIGKRIRQTPSNPWREIIGVVGNEHDDGVTRPAASIVFWPMLQDDFWDVKMRAQRSMAFAIRSERLRDPGFLKEIQQAVWAVNPNLPLASVETLQEIYDKSMAQTSFTLVILGIASGVTLLLGVVGIYGVIAYVVAQRRREVGIRMALGAAGGEVQRLFVRHGLAITGIGLLIGGVAAAALSRLLGSLLFNVSPLDPLTYGGGIVALGLVALIATWIPARQATRIDPATAIR